MKEHKIFTRIVAFILLRGPPLDRWFDKITAATVSFGLAMGMLHRASSWLIMIPQLSWRDLENETIFSEYASKYLSSVLDQHKIRLSRYDIDTSLIHFPSMEVGR